MLAELEFDHNAFSNQVQQDNHIAPRFFLVPVKNEERSVQEGRPIFEDVEMVELRVRGDRNNIPQKPVDENIKRRFSAAYQAFKSNMAVPVEGTPLKEWPHASASMIEELKYLGFQTVEHIAAANDSVCSRVPGLVGLKQRAIAFIELSKGAAPLEKLQTALEQEKSKREVLEAQVAELSKLLSAKEKPSK